MMALTEDTLNKYSKISSEANFTGTNKQINNFCANSVGRIANANSIAFINVFEQDRILIQNFNRLDHMSGNSYLIWNPIVS